ncbi:hypothetical protein ACFL1B_02385 [Nanoarchaeota archaeon]
MSSSKMYLGLLAFLLIPIALGLLEGVTFSFLPVNISVGDNVSIHANISSLNTSLYSLELNTPNKNLKFRSEDDITFPVSFVPESQGEHIVRIIEKSSAQILVDQKFNVSDREDITLEETDAEQDIEEDIEPEIESIENQSNQTNISEKPEPEKAKRKGTKGVHIRDSKGRKIQASTKFYLQNKILDYSENSSINITDGLYDVELEPRIRNFLKVKLKEVNYTGSLELKLEALDEKPQIKGKKAIEAFAIDPSEVDFESGTITRIATGKQLWKCKDWDFDSQTCFGTWVQIMDLIPGQEYNITINSSDPGFSETNLTIIDLQSYPTVGGKWTVRFITIGNSELRITASNSTTWSNSTETEDLKFLELKCGQTFIEYEWVNDTITIPNYYCNQTGYETSMVLTSGKHTLKFEFGEDIKYAKNLATTILLYEGWESGDFTCSQCLGVNGNNASGWITWQDRAADGGPNIVNTCVGALCNGTFALQTIGGDGSAGGHACDGTNFCTGVNHTLNTSGYRDINISFSLTDIGNAYESPAEQWAAQFSCNNGTTWNTMLQFSPAPGENTRYSYNASSTNSCIDNNPYAIFRIWQDSTYNAEDAHLDDITITGVNLNTPPSTPTGIQCDDSNNCNDIFSLSVKLNASGSTDSDSEAITYTLQATLDNATTTQDTSDTSFTGTGVFGGWSSSTTIWSKLNAIGCTSWTGNSGWETSEFRFWVDDDNRDDSGDYESVRYEFCSGDDSPLRILNASTCWVDNQNPFTDTSCTDTLQVNPGEGTTGSWLYTEIAQSGSPGGTCEFTPWMNYTWMGNRNYFLQWGVQTGAYDGNVYSNTGCSASRLSRIQDTVADVMDPAWATDAWDAFSYDLESIEGRVAIVGATNETNTTETNYSSLGSGYNSVNSISVTIEVDSYNPEASVTQGTRDPDLALVIYNGTGFISAGLFNLNNTYTSNGLNTTNTNITLVVTDSAILTAIQDISIRGVYIDFYNAATIDEINYTNIWITINGKKWTDIGNHTETTSYSWDTTSVLEQTCVDLRARAIDLDGSHTYSGYYTKVSCLNITRAPSITNPVFNKSVINQSESVRLNVTVTDESTITSVTATLVLPNSTAINISMTYLSGITYTLVFSDTNNTGTYNITNIVAIDEYNEINNSQFTILAFQVTASPPAVFNLLTPTNYTVSTNLQPSLTWEQTVEPNFLNYTILIDKDSGFGSPDFTYTNPGISNTSKVLESTLDSNSQYYWRVIAYDIFGNSRIANNDFIYITDNTTPSVVLNKPEHNNYVTVSSFQMNYTPTDTNLANCTLYADFTGSFVENQTDQDPLNNQPNYFNVTLNDGTYIWNVLCLDLASNSAFATANYTVKVDTQVPEINLESPANNTHENTTNNILFKYNVTDTMTGIASCEIIMDNTVQDNDNSITEGISQNFTLFVENGQHNWSINCTDQNGFESASDQYNLSVSVIFESDPPVIIPNYPGENAFVQSSTISFNYTPGDASGLENCSIYIDSQRNFTNSSPVNNMPNYFTVAGFSDTSYDWQIECFDNNTYAQDTSDTRTVTIDTINPTISLNMPGNATFVQTSTQTFNYTPADTNLENCSLYADFFDETFQEIENNDTITSSVPNYFTRNQNDGIYIWNIRCWDRSGRNAFDSQNNTVYVDVYSPAYSSIVVNPASSTNYSTRTYSFNITWTDEFLDTVLLEHNFTGSLTNTTISGSSGDIFSYTIDNLESGTYRYKWIANDTTGKTNQTSQYTYTVNKGLGNVNLTLDGKRQDKNIVQGASVDIAASIVNPPTGFIQLFIDGSLINSGTSSLANTTQFNDAGTYNVTAVYPETANYSGYYETHFVTVNDTQDPIIGLIFPEDDSSISATTVTFKYNVSDYSSIQNCSLYINGTLNDTSTSVLKDQDQTFPVSMDNGTYSWRVDCYDNPGNFQQSPTWEFSLQSSASMNLNVDLPGNTYQQGQLIPINTTVRDVYNNSVDATVITHIIAENASKPWWNTSWKKRMPLTFTEPDGETRMDTIIQVNITGLSGNISDCDEVRIVDHQDPSGEILDSRVENGDDNSYCTIKFYADVSASESSSNRFYTYYNNTGASALSVTRAFETTILFHDGETPAQRNQWTMNPFTTDTATCGWFDWDDPNGYQVSTIDAQPQNDVTTGSGTYALFTGPDGDNSDCTGVDGDVDGGNTSMTSPTINLQGWSKATMTVHRWYYSNDNGANNDDICGLRASTNNGTNYNHTLFWLTDDDNLTDTDAYNHWSQRTYQLHQILPLNNQLKLLLDASDHGDGDIVECGFDEFNITAQQSNIQMNLDPAEEWVTSSTNTTTDGTWIWHYDSLNTPLGSYAAASLGIASEYANASDTASFTLVADTTPPNITLKSPAPNASDSNTSVFFNWTAFDYHRNQTCNLSIDGELNLTDIFIANNINVNRTVTGILEGTHYWNVTCSDLIGNLNTSETRAFAVMIQPTVFNLTSPGNNTYSSNLQPTMTWQQTSDDNFANYTIILDTDPSFGSPDFTYVNIGVTNTSRSADNPLTPESTYYWRVIAYDTYENSRQSNKDFIYITDNTTPSVVLNKPEDDDYVTTASFQFNYTPSDINLVNCTLYHDASGSFQPNQTIDATSGQPNYFNITMADGTYFWNVQCQDLADNTGFASANFTVKVDTTAPNVYLEEPGNSILENTTNNVVFKYNVSDAMTGIAVCEIIIDGTIADDDISITEDQSQNFTIFVENGQHNWSINCTDQNGFESSSVTRNLTVYVVFESDPPVVILTYPPENNYLSFGSFSFNYTPSDASGVENCSLYIDGAWNHTNTSIINDMANYFSAIGFGDNEYTWQVQCYDNNTYAFGLSDTYNFTVDLINPNIQLHTPENNNFVQTATALFNYTPTDTNLDNCSLYGNFSGGFTEVDNDDSVTNGVANNITHTFNDGTYLWAIMCYDKSGRSNFSQNYTVKKDTIAPGYSNININPSSPVSFQVPRTYEFNITWTDIFMDSVRLEHNFTGTLINQTIFGSSNVYSYTVDDLKPGRYRYRWYANDSTGKWNYTDQFIYNVTKSTGEVNLLLNGSSQPIAIAEDTVLNITGTLVTPSNGYIEIYLNDLLINNGSAPLTNLTLFENIGTYNVTVIYPETENYTQSSELHVVTVQDTTEPVVTLISPQEGATSSSSSVYFYYNVTDDSPIQNCSLYINSSLIDTDDIVVRNITQSFTQPLANGSFSYHIICYDNFDNYDQTGTINFSVQEGGAMSVTVDLESSYMEGQIIPINTTVLDGFNNSLDGNVDTYIIKGNGTQPWWNTSWKKRMPLTFTEPDGETRMDTIIQVNITGLSGNISDCDEVRIVDHQDPSGEILDSRVENGDDNSYCTIKFYADVSASESSSNRFYTYYNNTGASALSVTRAFETTILFHDGETPAQRNQWTMNPFTTDTATCGWFDWDDPNGYQVSTIDAQPQNDVTTGSGTYALFTGPDGDNSDCTGVDGDVDGGNTSMTSPTINLQGWSKATMTVHRWYYSNDNGANNDDICGLRASTNNGTNYNHTLFWLTDDDNLTDTDAYNHWSQRTYQLHQILPLNNQLKLLLDASDHGDGDIVECGFDEFNITAQQSNIQITQEAPEEFVVHASNSSGLDGTWIWHYDSLNMPLGNYSAASLGLVEGYQNASGYSNFVVMADTKPPTITLNTPINNANSSDTSVVFNWTAFDYHRNQTCNLSINGEINITGVEVANNVDVNRTVVMTAGMHTWNITCVDSLGYANTSATWSFFIDLSAPNITLNLPVYGYNTSSSILEFNWTAIDNHDVSMDCNVSIDGSIEATGISSDNNTETNATISGIPAGTKHWNVTCVDSAGNSVTSNTWPFYILSAPTNGSIELSSNLQDVILNWEPVTEAVDYDIFITENFTKGFDSTPNITGVTDSNYTDTTASSSSKKFYMIRANRGNANKNFTTYFGKSDLQQEYGLNLVSLPFVPQSTVLSTGSNNGFEFKLQPDCLLSLWRYSSGSFERSDWNGTGFTPAAGSETFTSLAVNKGYWIDTNSSCKLTFIGEVSNTNTTVPLSEGWTIVPWHSVERKKLPTDEEAPLIIVNPAQSVKTINRYNSTSSSFELTSLFILGNGTTWGWFPSFTNPDFTHMDPNRGYYFDTTPAATWEHEP